MYWTVHMQDYDILRIRRPIVCVEDTIYSFGFSDYSGASNDDLGPMDVYMMKTDNYQLSVLPHTDSTPPKRFGHSAVVYGEKVYMWGGEFGWGLFPELLCFDTATFSWSKPATTGVAPTSCRQHSSFVIGQRMFVLGGLNEPGNNFSQEIFTLDLETMQWGQLSTKGGPPFDIGTWVCAMGSQVYVFRGQSYYTCWNDAFCLDVMSGQWRQLEVRGWYPQLTYSAIFCYKGDMYVFGGRCRVLQSNCNDLCRFSPETGCWDRVRPAGDVPLPRHLATCVLCKDRLFLFGGIVNDCEMFGCLDFHILDLAPSLRTLCLMAVVDYNLDLKTLPESVRRDVFDMSGIAGVRFSRLS